MTDKRKVKTPKEDMPTRELKTVSVRFTLEDHKDLDDYTWENKISMSKLLSDLAIEKIITPYRNRKKKRA